MLSVVAFAAPCLDVLPAGAGEEEDAHGMQETIKNVDFHREMKSAKEIFVMFKCYS